MKAPLMLDEEKVFKDPVHRYVHVRHKVIWDLINSKEFQRLRRIRQLGATHYTFHGAEHSRFNHSLGVYEVMRRMVSKLDFSEEETLLCLCSALLHDIGHGPYSHSFEKVFHTDHEQWTRRIIEGDTEVNEILRGISDDFPKKVSEVIGKTYPNQMIVSLITSQCDADRMDYLLRDAYYTGVNYGTFDMERILRLLRIVDGQVVIKHSGMHAMEDYLVSRYQMYWQVYFHPVTRSAEVILGKIFKRAKRLYQQAYAFQTLPLPMIPFLEEREMSVDEYLAFDESALLYYIQQWGEEADPILSDLCQRFLHRKLFKYVEFDPQRDYRTWEDLRNLFRNHGLDPDYYLVVDSPSDLPYDFYRIGQEEGEKMPILLEMPDGSLEELSTHSTIVRSIAGRRRFDHKLYYPDELISEEIRSRLGGS